MKKKIKCGILPLTLLSLSINLFAADNLNPAHTLDRMMDNNRQGLDIARTGIQNISDVEFQKIFKEMIQDQENYMKQLDQLRNRLFPNVAKETIDPKVDLKDVKGGYDLKAEIPGMDNEDVKVQVVDNNITLSGVKESEVKNVDKNMQTSEISYGSFQRTIQLPEKVDPKSLKVEFDKGTVKIHVNKMKSKV